MKACKRGDYEIVEYFQKEVNYHEAMTSKDIRSENGYMKACQRGHCRVVELLLKNPIIFENINDKDILNSGEEELFSMLEYDFIDAEKLENLFQSVCSKGWLDVVDKLMKHPEYKDFILSSDNQGQSGFMKAIDNRQFDVMKLLLEHPLNHDIATNVCNLLMGISNCLGSL